jgi:hypothetical protein
LSKSHQTKVLLAEWNSRPRQPGRLFRTSSCDVSMKDMWTSLAYIGWPAQKRVETVFADR